MTDLLDERADAPAPVATVGPLLRLLPQHGR